MIELAVEITGLNQTLLALEAMEERAGNVFGNREVTNEIIGIIRENEERIFETEGAAFGGTRWARLSEPYRTQKMRRFKTFGRDKILQATGKLKRSVTGAGGRSFVERAGNELRIGTRLPYAQFHETGTSIMPARPFLRIGAQNQRRIAAVIARYVARGR